MLQILTSSSCMVVEPSACSSSTSQLHLQEMVETDLTYRKATTLPTICTLKLNNSPIFNL